MEGKAERREDGEMVGQVRRQWQQESQKRESVRKCVRGAERGHVMVDGRAEIFDGREEK